ncbi:hypothetical protein D9M71_627220 [compost metagenome]
MQDHQWMPLIQQGQQSILVVARRLEEPGHAISMSLELDARHVIKHIAVEVLGDLWSKHELSGWMLNTRPLDLWVLLENRIKRVTSERVSPGDKQHVLLCARGGKERLPTDSAPALVIIGCLAILFHRSSPVEVDQR